jgi:hypothetical protein
MTTACLAPRSRPLALHPETLRASAGEARTALATYTAMNPVGARK